MTHSSPYVVTEVRGQVGMLTLNRPQAINALTLDMVRSLRAQLRQWQSDPDVLAVAIRGSTKEGVFGHFCAGGDIRFLHRAGSVGDPQLEDFFTEEYALNHLIFSYPKPYIAFMDGIVMGGGMGISQGASWRLVTERSKLAMPETLIGLFPDVGGGYFLSRCPGVVGEWLGLTGESLGAADALHVGLADGFIHSQAQELLWQELGQHRFADSDAVQAWVQTHTSAAVPDQNARIPMADIERFFSLPTVTEMMEALERDTSEWAQRTAHALRQRSPLMLHVVLEQIRRARKLDMAQDLRMERGMVRYCFYGRPGQSETLEGIRALAVDKDHQPRWSPARIEDVSDAQWLAFFDSPWPDHAHPLRDLSDAG